MITETYGGKAKGDENQQKKCPLKSHQVMKERLDTQNRSPQYNDSESKRHVVRKHEVKQRKGWEPGGEDALQAETMVKGQLTWLQVALKRFSPKPWLAVLAVIKFRDERKMAGNLSIVADLELLLL